MTEREANSQFDGVPPISGEAAAQVTELGTSEKTEAALARLRLLWNARRALTRIMVAGMMAGTLIAFTLPKCYESSAQLMPSDTQSNSPLAMLGARTGTSMGTFAGDQLGMKNTSELFIGILHSRTAEDRLVQRFNLRQVYRVSLGIDARKTLAQNTAISADHKSGIITITVTDTDPRRAAALAQAYIQELDHLVVELSTSAAHRERVFLEERLKAVKLELDQASQAFSQFASKNTAIDIKEQGKAMMDAAALLMGQLIAAESELKGLEEIYTPNNVRVRSVQARIAELRKQLEKMGGKGLAEANDLVRSGDSVYPSIRKLPLLGVAYGDLYRRTRIQETVFETLTQEYELAKVQEAKEIPSVKVLDTASMPERKSFPPRFLIILLCMFMSFLGGVCWILARAHWDKTDSNHPGKILAQEVLEAITANMRWAPAIFARLKELSRRPWGLVTRRRVSAKEAEEAQNCR